MARYTQRENRVRSLSMKTDVLEQIICEKKWKGLFVYIFASIYFLSTCFKFSFNVPMSGGLTAEVTLPSDVKKCHVMWCIVGSALR